MSCFGCFASSKKALAETIEDVTENLPDSMRDSVRAMAEDAGITKDDPKSDSRDGDAADPSDVAIAGTGTASRAVQVDGVTLSDEDFENKVKTAIPGLVRMFSGCHDTQTSADVSNTASFQLPVDAGPGGAGGAATNSLIATLTRDDAAQHMTWVDILESMRKILSEKGYEQVPQLSASRNLNLSSDKFSFLNPAAQEGSKRRALLVGINYVGQRGELSGCHNDVASMRMYLEKQGFLASEMRILMDDGHAQTPTAANLVAGFDWLTEACSAGDSLVFHYSGHGGYVQDDTGDEEDGRDETLVPLDFEASGQIRDDLVFKELVLPVPEGVTLSCVMDCCHSGTVLDLPYSIKASEHLESGTAQMTPNPGFSFKKLFTIAMKLYKLKSGGASNAELAKHAAGEFMPMISGAGGAPGAAGAGGKTSGGLGNLLALASGAMAGGGGAAAAGGSNNESGGGAGAGLGSLMSMMGALGGGGNSNGNSGATSGMPSLPF